uniref:Dual specificity phosphatase 28 n=1 Tax=Monodelphis domestica TaxID=13616 RepID=F7FYZ5_MONDO
MDTGPAAPAGGPAEASSSENGRRLARITPWLLLGPARAATDAELLAREHITFCVNVTRQQPCPRALGVRTIRVPVFDDPAEDLLTHLEPCCAALEAAARAGSTCLVYCKNGRSRSAAVCTAYLIRHGGLSLQQAFQVVKNARPVAEPNPGFWAQLQKYEEALQKGPPRSPSSFRERLGGESLAGLTPEPAMPERRGQIGDS